MDELVHLIVSSHARWQPLVVEAVLGTNDPVLVAEALTQAVDAALEVPIVGARFYETGAGVVVGLDLADGRSVVAKVHRATFTPFENLVTIARLQADLVWLTIEAYRRSDTADGYDPVVFVADYEAERGGTFDDHEREVLTAAQRWIASYGARRQHSDHLLGPLPDVDHSQGWPRLLRQLLHR